MLCTPFTPPILIMIPQSPCHAKHALHPTTARRPIAAAIRRMRAPGANRVVPATAATPLAAFALLIFLLLHAEHEVALLLINRHVDSACSQTRADARAADSPLRSRGCSYWVAGHALNCWEKAGLGAGGLCASKTRALELLGYYGHGGLARWGCHVWGGVARGGG